MFRATWIIIVSNWKQHNTHQQENKFKMSVAHIQWNTTLKFLKRRNTDIGNNRNESPKLYIKQKKPDIEVCFVWFRLHEVQEQS